jgi:hypothetical protein
VRYNTYYENVRVIVCDEAFNVDSLVPPQFELLIIGLSAYVLDTVQLPKLENSTATPPILGVPHPSPTFHATPSIVSEVIVAVLNPFAKVCTKVGWVTVKLLPLVLDHIN